MNEISVKNIIIPSEYKIQKLKKISDSKIQEYDADTFISSKNNKITAPPKVAPLYPMASDIISGGAQIIPRDTFFIKMEHYGQDKNWAQKMINSTYFASDMIKRNETFFDILVHIIKDVRRINADDSFGRIKMKNGAFVFGEDSRGCEYLDKYKSKLGQKHCFRPVGNDQYRFANTCRICFCDSERILINYGFSRLSRSSNLSLAKKEFEKLRSIENPTEEEILCSCATIQWLIAQESPWQHGNDSIANILTKAILHSYGIRISAPKENTSFDFEAFCSNLDDYIKNYPSFFEIPPHKISK